MFPGHEPRNVLWPFAHCGDFNGNDAQAEEEILAEGPLLDHFLKVLVGGCEDTHIGRDVRGAPHPAEWVAVKNVQKGCLGREGKLRYLVQEEGTIVGKLENALSSLFGGTGKGPGFVAEQFRFEQGKRDARAVEGDKVHVLALAQVVDGLGRHGFASACFSLQKHRRVGMGRHHERGSQLLGCRRCPQYSHLQHLSLVALGTEGRRHALQGVVHGFEFR